MATVTAAEIDAGFFGQPRIGTFMTSSDSGKPIGVPVWFEWTGSYIQLFSARDARKVRQLESGQSMTLLVANSVGEPERWYAFDGDPEIYQDGALALAERLASRYWDTTAPASQQMLQTWRQHAGALCRICLEPARIRTGS